MTECDKCKEEGITCKPIEPLGFKIGRRIIIRDLDNLISFIPIEECSIRNQEVSPEDFARKLDQIKLL